MCVCVDNSYGFANESLNNLCCCFFNLFTFNFEFNIQTSFSLLFNFGGFLIISHVRRDFYT